jgi:type I restriction enzyme S subunit
MKKYDSYKSSDIEWIGVIPEHWTKSKFKYVTQLFTGNSLNDEQKLQYESDNIDDIPYVSSKDINLDFRSVNYFNGQRIPKENNPLKISPKGSFLLCVEGGSSGRKMVFLDRDVCFVNKLCSFYSVQNTKFQYYFIQSSNFQNKFKFSLTGLIGGVSISTLKDFDLPLPPLHEQEQIVNYLDEKTTIIDKLISTKQRKVELLKEHRTTLINQVITKGLNPNVKMKDSGVEWIGDIPEHWTSLGFTKIIKIRHGYQFREYDFTDSGIKIIKITQLDRDGFLNLENCSFIDKNRIDEFERIMIYQDDVLMCLTGGTIGKIIKVGEVNEPLIQNYRVGHFSPLNNKILNDYIFWFMTSPLTTSQMFSEIRETGQPNIGMEDFGKMKVMLPTISEQEEIIDFLVIKTKEIDDLVSMEQKKIELLKEYRQSLISEVITGKIKIVK